MCGLCWSEVPRELQRDVVRTWRTYSATRGDYLDPDYHARKRAARLAYQAARDAALGAVQ